MGKPSSRRCSRKLHSHSSISSSSQHKMNARKMENIKRKNQNRTKSKIKSLFSKLKRQSEHSFTSQASQNASVVFLDTSEENDTVVEVDTPTTLDNKRTGTPNETVKWRETDDSLIIINDDDINPQSIPLPETPRPHRSPIHCSTPVHAIDNQILSVSNNNYIENVDIDIANLTKEINTDSYLTIDLTAADSVTTVDDTVIHVDLPDEDDFSYTSESSVMSAINASLSMSAYSKVTTKQNKVNKRKQINNFAKGISNLNSSEKGKLLELIAQNIFNGCKISGNLKSTLSGMQQQSTSAIPDTPQDSFIKEVILGEVKSRNSIGSNIYHPSKDVQNKKGLRMIVIDGSNIAMEHTKGARFSVSGLKICIDYFMKRGHVVKAFVPRFRCKNGKSSDPKLLSNLERRGLVVFTPSREIQGRICVPYDDRYIVQCAAEFDGVIVSNDNYRDLHKENPRWRSVIENRLLPFTWVNDMIMFPRDPLGRNGPTLEEFLRHPRSIAPTIVVK